MDELNYLVSNYNIPSHITEDVSRRVTDWIASGGNEDDSYIMQQVRYIKNYLKVSKRDGGKDE